MFLGWSVLLLLQRFFEKFTMINQVILALFIGSFHCHRVKYWRLNRFGLVGDVFGNGDHGVLWAKIHTKFRVSDLLDRHSWHLILQQRLNNWHLVKFGRVDWFWVQHSSKVYFLKFLYIYDLNFVVIWAQLFKISENPILEKIIKYHRKGSISKDFFRRNKIGTLICWLLEIIKRKW